LRRGLGVLLGGGPEVLVLLEPVADGALHADVVTGVPGLDPPVSWDLVALFEQALSELVLGEGTDYALVVFFCTSFVVTISAME
jgi:hypothetical protein